MCTYPPSHHADISQKTQQDQWDLVGRTIRGEDLSEKQLSHRTIFHELLQSNLPPEDKAQKRLADEAFIVVGAGIETTANALTVCTFHIVNQPRIYKRLHEELVAAFPDPSVVPPLLELEKLPYLKACILEALRLSYGLSARHPRKHDRPLQYRNWTIPAHTVVSMTIVDISHDPAVFPDSRSYIPERWLNDPKTATGVPLERYLVAFGRGPRSCLGIKYVFFGLFLSWIFFFVLCFSS